MSSLGLPADLDLKHTWQVTPHSGSHSFHLSTRGHQRCSCHLEPRLKSRVLSEPHSARGAVGHHRLLLPAFPVPQCPLLAHRARAVEEPGSQDQGAEGKGSQADSPGPK